MNLDFLGAEQHFTVLSGSAPTYRLDFVADSGEPIALDNVTFDGLVTAPDGTTGSLDVSQGSEDGSLFVIFPVLSAGNYEYELRATNETGDRLRIAYGRLGVLPTSLDLTRVEDDTEVRRLAVRLPNVAAAHCMLEWRASIDASRAAQEAAAAAKELRGKLADAEARIENTAEQAAEAVKKADEAVGKLESLDELLDKFRAELATQVNINPETNTWVVAGVDLGIKATGEPGKSPKLSTTLTWMIYDDDSGEWRDSGVSAVGRDGKSPYISALGTWVEWLNGAWVDTERKAEGRDGRDGSAVRRIVIPSAADLPKKGETCNGGVYYYVPLIDSDPRALVEVMLGQTVGDVMLIDGYPIDLTAERTTEPTAEGGEPETVIEPVTPYELEEHINAAGIEGVRAEVTGNIVAIYSINRTLTVERDNADAYDVREFPMIDREGYLVYAWLEDSVGANWYKVGEANDLATAEIYGLTKLATNSPVVNGAPVGNDEHGALHVPRADFSTPGAVRPAIDEPVTVGGAVGLNGDGRMMAQPANAARYGVMRHSNPNQAGAGCIGLMSDGATGARWATLEEPGVSKLGSEFGQLNRIPYQQGVGATTDHQLANNLLFSGALQHQKKAYWSAKGMNWLNSLPESEYYNSHDFYTGLCTSSQFAQSESVGLQLVAATGELLAGCYIARSVDGDKRVAAVPNASTTYNYLTEHYYRKEEVYTQTQTREYVAETLKPYATQSWVEGKGYDTVAGVDKKLEGYIQIQPDVLLKFRLLTRQEYIDLPRRDKTTLYIQCASAALQTLQS